MMTKHLERDLETESGGQTLKVEEGPHRDAATANTITPSSS